MRSRRFSGRALCRSLGSALLLIVPAMALGAGGCNAPDLQGYCEQRGSCRGSNEQDVEACVVALETEEWIIDDIGCGDEFSAYFDCVLEKGDCIVVTQGQPCQTHEDCSGGGQCTVDNVCETKDFQTENDDCELEQNAYQRCYDLD